ncbi:MAG: SusC/RagA family TonB-linked outer membrane protein [Bacteroidales bacterium]|nr:SusC/RagA family TonB-linked outer membrane protein [Bacteroidales bacterium]
MLKPIAKRLTILTAIVLSCLSFSPQAFAQNTVKGTVYDTDRSSPLPGATVSVEGKASYATTDLDGKFSVQASQGDVLLVQFMGYQDQKVTVGKQAGYEVVLKPSNEFLNESVVTALGMTREKRSLGYAVVDVSGDALNQSQSSNWLGGLEGKVPGVQFNKASGPMSSTRVIVRGDPSLSGTGSALFVVDGVPIESGAISNASGSGYTNQDNPIDFGDNGSDLNPDDIESITVLKGAAATALYGSRAGNGAIIITTKSGEKQKGIGVTLSSRFTWDVPGYWPDFQTTYGPGNDLGLDEYVLWNWNPEGLSRHYSRYAFGEAYDPSVLRYQWNSVIDWETGEMQRTPFVYAPDWYSGIFRTGVTMDNSVSIDGGNGKGTKFRLSANMSRNDWILPNTGYRRNSISFSFKTPINKWIDFNAKVNYYMTDSDNLPSAGYSNNGVMYQMVWNRTNVPMSAYADEYFSGRWNREGFNNPRRWLLGQEEYYNPYRVLYEMTNTQDKDRIFGNAGFHINLWKEKLTLDVKSGLDIVNEFRTQRKPYYTYNYTQGWYREQNNFVSQINTDFLLKYSDTFFEDRLSFMAAVGGNNMTYQRRSHKVTIDKLDIEGVYNPTNYPAETIPEDSYYRSTKVVNSLYGLLSIGWKDMLYLDVTARNDWTSTLSPDNWSFFYPSVSASAMLDKLLGMRHWAKGVDMLKLRASWANVGRDTNPYAISYGYTSTDFPGGYRPAATLPDYYLKPENVATIELGIEGKFLRNRLGFDVAVFQSDVTDQIYDRPVDYMTGAKYYTSNIGLIRSKGLEISLFAVPVKTRDFSWTINLNAATNTASLLKMYDGWDNAQPHQTDMGTTIGSRLFIYNYVGQKMGQMWGKGLALAPEGSYILDADGNRIPCGGQVVINESTGLPSLSDDLRYLGNVNPDWTGGLSTSFRYKGLTLNATFSAQLGGNTFSVTAATLGYQGKLKNTLEGRPDGLVAEGVNLVGQDAEGNNIYKVNETLTNNVLTYWSSFQANRYNFKEYIYDNSFLKLKELTLTYDFPKSLISKTRVLQGVSISGYATNLFCISNYPFFDPEVTGMNDSNTKRGIESGSFPMSRGYGFNIKVKF